MSKARAKGKIPEGVDVKVDDPGDEATDLADVTHDVQERLAKADDVSDEEYLAKLPLINKLEGVCLDIYKRDALLWRMTQSAFREYKAVCRLAIKAATKGRRRTTKGQFEEKLGWHLEFQDPTRWKICPPTTTEEGSGCAGTGRTVLGPCSKCHERGYLAR